MAEWVSKEAIRVARRVNLYDFLSGRHPNDVSRESDSLRLDRNHSVSVRCGYSGYLDFSTGDKGNSVEFLVRYLGYDFKDAVAALCEFAGIDPTAAVSGRIDLAHLDVPQYDPESKKWSNGRSSDPGSAPQDATMPDKPVSHVFVKPEPVQGSYRHLFAYLLKKREIPVEMIQKLIDWGLLYQEREHNNMVFINPEGTFAELRGTNSEIPFHQVRFSDLSSFWWFKPKGPSSVATIAYICESAIDAISLYLLHQLEIDPSDQQKNPLYCSIGGVANQHRIDCIKAGMVAAGCMTILAVDSDKAGAKCRQENQDLWAIIPKHKDWNEDWIEAVAQRRQAAKTQAEMQAQENQKK